MSLPIDRTTKAALDANLVNGNTSDAPVIKNSNDVVYNTIDELNNKVNALIASGALSPYPPSFILRQALINGNFDIWQRGTSFSSATAGYGPDRWFVELSSATLSRQSAGAPVGSQYYSRITTTASGFGNYYQALESDIVKKLNGKKITFSVNLRKNTSFASDITVLIQKNATADTIAGGTWTTIISNVVPTASIPTGTTSADWYTIPVTATIPNDGTANGIRILIQQTAAQPTGAYYEASQAQINTGDIALLFQPRSFADELALCHRYYEKSYDISVAPKTASSNPGLTARVVPSNTIAIGQPYGGVSFKVSKRIAPTVGIYPFTTPTNTGRVSSFSTGADLPASTASTNLVGVNGFNVFNGSGATQTTDNNTVVFHWDADAEL